MNRKWLARAKMFEIPGKILCAHGHDLDAEGIYTYTQVRKGKKYGAKKCRRCAIEQVQRCRAKKRLAERLAA